MELHLFNIEYHRHQRIPRGLRAQSRPNLFSQDQEFRLKYEQISNKYAFDMILLNVEFLSKEMHKIQVKMVELKLSLRELLTAEEFERFLQRNESFLQKHRAELQDLKRRKWFRDINDYQLGRVCNWTFTKPMDGYKGLRTDNIDTLDTNKPEVF